MTAWDAELPWDSPLNSADFEIPCIIDSETLEHRLRVLGFSAPSPIDPAMTPLISALLDAQGRAERSIERLQEDLRQKDAQLREADRRHKQELNAVREEIAQVQKLRGENSKLREKLGEHKNLELKLQAKIAAAEKLAAHFQRALRQKQNDKLAMIDFEASERENAISNFLVEAEAPEKEVSAPFKPPVVRLQEEEAAAEKDKAEEISELDILRGLVGE